MATVNSVMGPIDTDDLGFTLSHEHVGTNAAGLRHTYPEIIDRDGIREQSIAAMRAVREDGVRTVIDVSTFDLGRDVQLIREVALGSDMQVVVATGNHLAVPRPFGEISPDVIAELYVAKSRRASRARESRPASSRWPATRAGSPAPQENVLRAAARAQKSTGVPISTHTWSPERIGDAQVRILEEEGVDLDRVYIGHSNDDTDLEYLLGLLNKGVWLGLDRYPGGTRPGTPDWEQRTEVAKALMDAGFTHRIFLSHDYSVPKARHGAEVQEQRRRANPDGYTFIPRYVLPRLKEMGASDADIHQITVENPRRFFAGE